MNRSCEILQECIELQKRKAEDYQNDASTVVQADYYINGISTIYDTMHGKMLRIKSIQETMQNNPDYKPNHEALVDSIKDLINYASFYGAYLDNKIPGQSINTDAFNRKKSLNDNDVHYMRPVKFYNDGSDPMVWNSYDCCSSATGDCPCRCDENRTYEGVKGDQSG